MGLWKEIYKESFSIKQHNNLILGDGSIIKFWEDAWCNEEPFSMLTKVVRGSFGVGLWKEIYKESFSIKQHNNLILGDGSIIKF